MEQVITLEKYLEEVEHRGYVRGRNMAAAQTKPLIGEMVALPDTAGLTKVESIQEQYDCMERWAYVSEENDRSFSPFEFTAYEFNSRDDADDIWAKFQDGIEKGITEELDVRFEKPKVRWAAAYAATVVEEGNHPNDEGEVRAIAKRYGLTEDETEALVQCAQGPMGTPTGA